MSGKPHKSFGPAAIARALTGAASPALKPFGFERHEIVTRWPLIVGESLAQMTHPERLSRGPDGACLTVRVEGAAALELQHQTPQVISRINAYFGADLVRRLKLLQGPVPRRRSKEPMPDRPLTQSEIDSLARAAAPVAHAGLRASLLSLGKRMLARKP